MYRRSGSAHQPNMFLDQPRPSNVPVVAFANVIHLVPLPLSWQSMSSRPSPLKSPMRSCWLPKHHFRSASQPRLHTLKYRVQNASWMPRMSSDASTVSESSSHMTEGG